MWSCRGVGGFLSRRGILLAGKIVKLFFKMNCFEGLGWWGNSESVLFRLKGLKFRFGDSEREK